MNAESNARRILSAIDSRLNQKVELTLYGRAAIHLGFPQAPTEFALSLDVDAVLWVGQAQELADRTNFWEAVEDTNASLAPQGLYVSHLFEESQVILRPCWRAERVRLQGAWKQLELWRLGDVDLFLSKLMRRDPQDLSDALFIARASGLTKAAIQKALEEARVPEVAEIHEQFALCSKEILERLHPPG